MCTAINIEGKSHFFGRTLDLEGGFGEMLIITPRGYKSVTAPKLPKIELSIIGIGFLSENFPLYYDGMNEAGLCGAALNFSDFCHYNDINSVKNNTPSYAVLLSVLGACKSVEEAKTLLSDMNITGEAFNKETPPSPLHWIFADKNSSVTVECDVSGTHIYDNPFGVLTNSPSFPYHSLRICDFLNLSPKPPKNELCKNINLSPTSRGMGAMGLPGDLSSQSRFIRAFFTKTHTRPRSTDGLPSCFFHIMDTVSQPYGVALTDDGKPIFTIYTSCIDTDKKIYYFTTYDNRSIRAVKLTDDRMNSKGLSLFDIFSEEYITEL